MRKYLIAAAACCLGSLAYAENCPLPALASESVAYQQGVDVPVITGAYQFNLPTRPDALLAFDGVMAVLPEQRYVSYQLISNETVAALLSRFSTSKFSAAALDKHLYGLTPLDDLLPQDQDVIRSLRRDMNLNCHSELTRYLVGGAVEVILQEPTGSDTEYRLLYFAGDLTHLVSVKGTREQAFAVLKSIRKR